MASFFPTGNQSFTARVEGNNVWYDIAEAAPDHGGKYECDWSAANDEVTHYVNVVGKHDSSNVMIQNVSVVNVVGKGSSLNRIFHHVLHCLKMEFVFNFKIIEINRIHSC